MRANTLVVPIMRALLPPMTSLTVLFHIQQMHQCLDEVRDVEEWITAVEDTVIAQVAIFDTVPDLSQNDKNGENFDYKVNLD